MKGTLLLLCGFIYLNGIAQNDPGVSITLQSSVLKEARKIQVYSPASTKTSKQTYPVLYILDGESLYWPAIGALRFMNYSSYLPQVPEAVIVSIPNTNRDRDMPVPQQMMIVDGAKNFLQFLSEELAPYISRHYPVNGLNVLIGHSQGGLFAIYAGLEKPQVFPFILALDAPVTVNPLLLKDYTQRLTSSSLNFFSGETLFGWKEDLFKGAGNLSFQQKKIEDETHETMPYKGIYEGLKFLFRDHLPQQASMPLADMQVYYDRLGKKYNSKYDIPAKLLLAAAQQAINQFQKKQAFDIVSYYEKFYGKTQRSAGLLAKISSITKSPDERVSFYLDHPSPSADAIRPFLGKWTGTLYVPDGTDMNITWEIKKTGDKYVIDARVANSFNSLSDFLAVNGKDELAWGRKHNGGGIYLSLGRLSDDGLTLFGEEDLIGFALPEGVPPFKPNKFEFKKVKE